MHIHFFIWLFVTKCTQAQINGEFWWLNHQVAKMHGDRVPPPKFEQLSVFDNDESDKIVFRDDDNDILREPTRKNCKKEESVGSAGRREHGAHLQDETIIWPSEDIHELTSPKPNYVQTNTTHNASITNDPELNKVKIHMENNMLQENKDILIFSYPDNDNFILNNNNFVTTPINNIATSLSTEINENNKNGAVLFNDNISSENHIEDESQTQNICTYIKESDCCRSKGIIYNAASVKKHTPADINLICCILPLSELKDKKDSTNIYFPDSPCKSTKRYKRSNNEEISIALKQRKVLLQRRYGTQAPKAKPANTHTRIVNEEEYVDPYWNIKNINFHTNKNPAKNDQTKHEYENDYVEDYVVELPKPGLIGLYSDHQSSASWSFLKENKGIYGVNPDYDGINNDDDDDDDASFFGYSTIDPRLVNSKKKNNGSPVKLTTATSSEIAFDSQSQTINYQSNPDFQVLQGFKLLNLLPNRRRVYTKNIRKTTITESGADDSKETSVTIPFGESSEKFGLLGDEEQLFKGCGKVVKEPTKEYDEADKQIGEAEDGSHPWTALVVRTKRKQDVLCYATLVHPRAAVTAADCVDGTSPGEITVVAGMWDLSERSRSSHRVASTYIHSQYKPGSLEYNLAFLYWMNPLRLGSYIQPICLAEPPLGENCMLFGWGGFDQAIRMHSRWQRASILSSRECNSRLSLSKLGVDVPTNAFCASVRSKGTVSGIGGPLICNIDGRNSAVGVAIWRDNVLVLLSAREWTLRASRVLMAD